MLSTPLFKVTLSREEQPEKVLLLMALMVPGIVTLTTLVFSKAPPRMIFVLSCKFTEVVSAFIGLTNAR